MKKVLYGIKIFALESIIFFLTEWMIQCIKVQELFFINFSWGKNILINNFLPCCVGFVIAAIICVYARYE